MQNRIERFYLGTHNFMPLAAFLAELDWLDIRHCRWLEIIRYQNRLAAIDGKMWPKMMWRWDMETETDGWNKEFKLIVAYSGLLCDDIATAKVNMEDFEKRLRVHNRNAWRLEAFTTPKLCTLRKSGL